MAPVPKTRAGGRRPYVAPELKVLQPSQALAMLKQAAAGGSRAAKRMLRQIGRRGALKRVK